MVTPPSGTVTLLFTDIEGSTALWERHRDVMQAALAQHHAILRASIETNGGHVFNAVGDAFCAAFATASAGLAAAVAAQRSLHDATWGETPLRVRMGLPTGSAEAIDHDYRSGPTPNWVTRVMSPALAITIGRDCSSPVKVQHGVGRRWSYFLEPLVS
jgi:class 3 adenylate cyclase